MMINIMKLKVQCRRPASRFISNIAYACSKPTQDETTKIIALVFSYFMNLIFTEETQIRGTATI